jgi:hypothetical protein
VHQKFENITCSNIVALAGDVNINCSSLSPEQKKMLERIPSLLNKILANQADPKVVGQKLDEIIETLSRLNQTRPSETISAPNGIAVGGEAHVDHPTVNNYGPPVRRLATEVKPTLVACLALRPGTVGVSALAGDAEAYQYAQDWQEVFREAHWIVSDNIVRSFMVGQGDFSGTTVGANGTGTSYDPETPGGAALKCLLATKVPTSDKARILLYPDTQKDHIAITIGNIPVRSQ